MDGVARRGRLLSVMSANAGPHHAYAIFRPPVIPLAADTGFTFADEYTIGLLFIAVALFAAIGALSHQDERPFSASLIYLALGVVAALGIDAMGVGWLDPLR